MKTRSLWCELCTWDYAVIILLAAISTCEKTWNIHSKNRDITLKIEWIMHKIERLMLYPLNIIFISDTREKRNFCLIVYSLERMKTIIFWLIIFNICAMVTRVGKNRKSKKVKDETIFFKLKLLRCLLSHCIWMFVHLKNNNTFTS